MLQALDLLGSILQRAVEDGRLSRNSVRLVRKLPRPRKREVKPLAPATVAAMRAGANPGDAALISILAYAGLRPQEALALQWGDVRKRTLLIQRAVSLGEEKDTKTTGHRTARRGLVARQLGHDARLTLTTYGHVIDELDDQPRVPAEDAIRAARHGSCVPGVSRKTTGADAG